MTPRWRIDADERCHRRQAAQRDGWKSARTAPWRALALGNALACDPPAGHHSLPPGGARRWHFGSFSLGSGWKKDCSIWKESFVKTKPLQQHPVPQCGLFDGPS